MGTSDRDPWAARVDDRGTLRPMGDRAKGHLRAREGLWRVVPTPDELLVLQRVSPRQEEKGRKRIGRILLTGVISNSTDVIDVLNYIYGNQRSGVLVFVEGPVKKTLFFRDGDVFMATSNQEEDRLGAVLFRFGFVDQDRLQEVLQASGGKRLGQALVDRGLITVHDLYLAVRKQVEEIFCSLLLFRSGFFYYYTLRDDKALSGGIRLSTHGLLMEAVRRIDEMELFREKIPSSDVVLEVCPDVPPRNLDERESVVYCLVDGRRTLADIARESRFGEFETTKVIYHLLQMRYIRLRERGEAVGGLRPSAFGEAAVQVVETFNEVYRKILAEVQAKGRVEQLRRGLLSFFENPGDFADLFRGVVPAEDGSLPAARIAQNLSSIEVSNRNDYLYQALNELLFFMMFNAGQALDEEEERALKQKLDEIFSRIE